MSQACAGLQGRYKLQRRYVDTTVTAASVLAALISLVVSLIYLISHSATEMDLSMPAVWGDRDIGFESSGPDHHFLQTTQIVERAPVNLESGTCPDMSPCRFPVGSLITPKR